MLITIRIRWQYYILQSQFRKIGLYFWKFLLANWNFAQKKIRRDIKFQIMSAISYWHNSILKEIRPVSRYLQLNQMGTNDKNEFQDVCLRTIVKKTFEKVLNTYNCTFLKLSRLFLGISVWELKLLCDHHSFRILGGVGSSNTSKRNAIF